ncbi:MAG: hypothetical protein AAFX99_27820, partial [Myxococcota bacterium]
MHEPQLDIHLPEDTEALKLRIAQLEEELERHHRQTKRSRQVAKAGGWFAVRVVLGGTLNNRLTELFDALHAWHLTPKASFPRAEAAAALAATIHRVVRVGLVGL